MLMASPSLIPVSNRDMGLNAAVNSLCKPLLLFLIFGVAHVTYNLTQLQVRAAVFNLFMTAVGGGLIYFLCRMDFEIAAWLLIFLVPFFFVSLLALMVLSQLITTDVRHWNGPTCGTRSVISKGLFDSAESEEEEVCE